MQLSTEETTSIKSQNMFTGKNKKNIINLSSAEFAQRVASRKHAYIILTPLNPTFI